MKRHTLFLTVAISLLLLIHPMSWSVAQTAPWSVCFTPGGSCTDTVVKTLAGAKSSVYVQAYSFTSAPIAKALVDAHKRGVHVEVILDRSNKTQKYSSADFVAHAGIPTYIDAHHAIAHNKVIVIDGETVITGSFNFTKAAQEHNAENLLVVQDKALAAKYADNWETHKKHSDPYEAKGQEGNPKRGKKR